VTRSALVPFLLVLFLGPALPSHAQADPAPEPEAPAAIFDQKLGDVGVVLDADGTWTTQLSAGWGSGYSSDGSVLPAQGYPGYEHGVVFTQVPDFSLTLKLMERYYLEVAYRGSLDDRSFLLGYQGQPGEFVQWVKLGNASFSVPGRAGTTLAAGRRGAPAAGAAFSVGNVDLEFLARYEDGTRETKTYQGYREVDAQTVAIDAWIRNRFFRLPGAPVSGVQVLVADPAGSLVGTPSGGTAAVTYRVATATEAVVDTAAGEIRLPATATKRYLVTWSGAATFSSTSSTILGLTPTAETVNGTTYFLLAQPGASTPFEVRNRYALTTGTTGSILLVKSSDGTAVSGHPVTYASTQDWFEVATSEEAPFYNDLSPSLRGIYPTGAPPPATNTLPWVFRLPTTTTATSYSLGTDVLASSILVVRNGSSTTAFRYDADSGALSMQVPVYDTDTVVISFQRKSSTSKATDLVLWHGGRWSFDPAQALEWNLQSRWNLDQSAYTTEDLQSPGKVSASVQWTGSAHEWSWSVAATGGALLDDSTGHRRVAGWSSGGTVATLDGNALRPAAPPGTVSGYSLTAINRAPTYFRDYWYTDPLTGSEAAYAWGKSGVEVSPWQAEGWMGPYLVRGDGTRTDRLAVTEAEFSATTQWAGMEVFLDSGKARDLKATSAISAVVRLVGGQSGDKVFLQAGAVAEDFDGTGALRTLEYKAHPALAFSDNGTSRYFPVPEGADWGNDAGGDGTAGQDGDLVTLELTSSTETAAPLVPETSGWQTVRVVLTDVERQKLQAATGWRLVIVNTGTNTTGVRTLLAGPVTFEGSTWSVVADATASSTSSVSATEEDDASRTDGHNLRVDWSDRTSWSVDGVFSVVRPAAYKTLQFRYKVPATDSSSTTVPLKIDATDASGVGLHVSWRAPVTSSWVTARVDLRTGALTLDGVAATATSVVDKTTGSWDRMTISQVSASPIGPATGTLYFAEVEAVDPVWEAVGTTLATATWKQTESWPSSEVPVLSNVNLGLSSAHSGLSADDATWTGQTTFTGNLSLVRTSAEASFTRSADTAKAHGAYEATLPLAWPDGPSVEFTDKFSDQGLRSEKVVVGLPWVGSLETYARASGVPTTLDQQYRAAWTAPSWLPPGWSAGVSAQWDQSAPTDLTLGDFGPQWYQSWSWLAPPSATAPYHLVQSQGRFQLTGSPWSLSGSANAQASQTVAATTKWSPSGSWTLKAPVQGADGAWTLTPSVSKRVETVTATTAVLDPGESAAQAWDWLSTQPGGLLSLPFAEQGTDPWALRDVQTATVESTAALDWTRSGGSEWTDVVLPGAAGLKVVGTRGRETTADYRLGTVSAYAQARAINVFGALGTLPVAAWYQSDVWTWSVTGSKTEGTRTQDHTADAAVAVRSDLVLSSKEKVGLPVTYTGKWGTSPSQTLGIKPTWSFQQAADLPFEIPRWISPKSFKRQWVQEIATALDVGWEPTTEPVVRNLQVSWKGRYLLSDKSELDLTTKWGQQWQTTLMVVGLEADLALILSF
jgi:hypothetical protein